MPKKVISAGLLCLDITPVFQKSVAKEIQQLFVPGKLIEMGQADIHTGGSVANSGLAFQYFGAEVTLMGKIGQDPFGLLVQKILLDYGICDDLVVTPGGDTSYTVVISPPGIDRIFLHHSGVNNDFGYQDIDFDQLKDADLFHFGYPTIMKRLYENNAAETIKIFKKAKEMGVLTSLDMAAIDENSDAAKINWRPILKELMPYVDFFVPSVEELCFLVDREKHSEWMERSQGQEVTQVLDLEKDVKPLADQLIEWGAKIVLIKCGAPGMYLHTADVDTLLSLGQEYEQWADLDIFENSYLPKDYRSATGAGDVSLSAFILSALEGYAPSRCLQLATGAGACCVASYDALSGLMSFEEMIQEIDQGWEKSSVGLNQK